jgi:NAD(P)-dependent dehydrogenase (short-subunit alcohol dehydrogenase family)
MIQNQMLYALFAPDLEESERTRENLGERFKTMNALPIPWVEPVDISNAVLFLASDEARYITGVTLPVDAGATTK